MIGRVVGQVVSETAEGTVIVDVGGLGYELALPAGTLGRAQYQPDGQVILTVHTVHKQDQLELFGFADETERKVFRLLLGVPNVGPKTAIHLLGCLPPRELAAAIRSGDPKTLSKVPGIGKKTAERVLLELGSKVDQLGSAAPELRIANVSTLSERLRDALIHMGYKAPEAERAVAALGEVEGRSLSELLRESLAVLTR